MALGFTIFRAGQAILRYWGKVWMPVALGFTLLLTGCSLPQVSAESRLFLNLSTALVGSHTLPQTNFNGTTVGGFSALSYDVQQDRIYGLVDNKVNPRVYTLQLDRECTEQSEVTDESRLKRFALPHPSPPLAKGRGQDLSVSPLTKGGLRGVMQDVSRESNGCESTITVESVTSLQDPLKTEGAKPVATLDGEGMVLTRRGTFFIASEGNLNLKIPPRLSEFNRGDGGWLQSLPLPPQYWSFDPEGVFDLGVAPNQGLESLAINAEGDRLFSATQSPLQQDASHNYSRFLHYWIGEPEPLLISENLYPLDPAPAGSTLYGLSDLTSIDNAGHFLSLERSYSPTTGYGAMLYQFATGIATDTSGIRTLPPNLKGIVPILKQPLLNLADLNIPLQNLEGLALGPRLQDGSRSLLLISDNQFDAKVPTQVLVLRLGRRLAQDKA